MEGKKKKAISRLFQLAINDAIQSQLSLVSPIRKLMEKENIENRETKCKSINSYIPIQTDVSVKKSSSVSSDVFTCKNWKKTENCDTANAIKNEYVKEVSNNTKICQVRDRHTSISDYKRDGFSGKNNIETSYFGMTCSLDNLNSKEEILSPKSQKFALLNDFESLWIPKKNETFSAADKGKSSININLTERNKIESLNSRKSIDYDLPVFQLNDDSESITIQEPSQRSSFDCDLVFPVLQTPGSEFFQESEVLNNFIPPPRTMDVEHSSADEQEILAPHMYDKTVSQSCKSLGYPKYIDKETKKYSSEAILCADNFENFSKDSDSLLFDQYSTFKHFESMLSESTSSGSSENVIETDYYSHVCYPLFKAHPVDYLLCKDSNEQPDQNPDINYMNTKSSFHENLSGLLKHFPEFKSVI